MTITSGLKDSVEYVANDTTKTSSKKGKLIKGARIAKSIPTIPSKYFTIVNDNADKRGFNNTSKRFLTPNDDIPGPGRYIGVDDINNSLKKTSDSKNGYGNLASKTKRNNLIYVMNDKTPGAGTYNIQDAALRKHQDFYTGPSRIFKSPIADQENINAKKADNNIPAPNQYDINKSDKINFRVNNTCANAAFKSQSKRNIIQSHDSLINPAPGTYNVNESLLHNSVKIPFSSFKSKTKRTYNSYSAIDPTPGPADYRPNEFDSKESRQLLPRKHYLAISAPAAPLPPPIPNPGPGAYNTAPLNEGKKAYMSSSVFVSCTSRWTNEIFNENQPGPTSYTPRKLNKQSFLYNTEKKWV